MKCVIFSARNNAERNHIGPLVKFSLRNIFQKQTSFFSQSGRTCEMVRAKTKECTYTKSNGHNSVFIFYERKLLYGSFLMKKPDIRKKHGMYMTLIKLLIKFSSDTFGKLLVQCIHITISIVIPFAISIELSRVTPPLPYDRHIHLIICFCHISFLQI